MTYIYNSLFKEEINQYLKYIENQKLCLRYHKIYLRYFDKYIIENNCPKKFTKELVENFLNRKKSTNTNYCDIEVYIIKKFAKFLNIINENAYILNSRDYSRVHNFIPHIYTKEEITKIIQCVETSIQNTSNYPYNKIQLKLLIKILYCCGLRDSELINLKFQDINFNEKTIHVSYSKNNISRLIFINDSLINDIRKYKELIPNNLETDYIFCNSKKKKRNIRSIYIYFNKIKTILNLDKCRLHDFRHTFAVNNLNKWFRDGKDITSLLPILMTYMGHVSIKSTEYYLRFISEVYDEVLKKYEDKYKNLFPTLESSQDYE